MHTPASRIATLPSLADSLKRQVVALWCACLAWVAKARQRAQVRQTGRLLREMSARDLADLGIGPDQVDWLAQGRPRG